MFCPDCGAEVDERRRFCGKCGGQLNAGATGNAAVPPVAPVIAAQQPSLNTKFMYAFVALLVVVCVCGIVLYRHNDADESRFSTDAGVRRNTHEAELPSSPEQDRKNEASAVGTVRTLNTAEVTYASTYPAKGFAPLRALGGNGGMADENHALLIVDELAATGRRNGYQFTVSIPSGTSPGPPSTNYFTTATPAAGHTGRNFCGDASGVIRYAAQGDECTLASTPLQ
jgi:hypothetical protein